MAERYLIVNGDDFGMSSGINRGVVTAHECGILTSASLMVRWPAAVEAAAYARSRIELSVGLHVDLGEWALVGDGWTPVYTVVPSEDRNAVATEVEQQLATYRRLMDADPTHLDSHQHVHQQEPARTILRNMAQRLNVPLRHASPGIRHEGSFYGQAGDGTPYPEGISVANLCRILTRLQPGITELGCHPGVKSDLVSAYREERDVEVRVLCHPRVRAAVEAAEVRLCSFREAGRMVSRSG